MMSAAVSSWNNSVYESCRNMPSYMILMLFKHKSYLEYLYGRIVLNVQYSLESNRK